MLALASHPVNAQTVFFDDFCCGTMNPVWQASLPEHYPYPPHIPAASYVGIPHHSFQTLGGASVLHMTDVLVPRTYRGWSTNTTFSLSDFRYEVRLNTLNQSPTTSIDGFVQIWIIDAMNPERWDNAYLFASSGVVPLFVTASSVDGGENILPFEYQDDTWYRLVLQGSSNQNIRASVLADDGTELISRTFAHNASAYNSGFRIALSQIMGIPSGPAPVDVAVDYVRLDRIVIPEPATWLLMALASAGILCIAHGRNYRTQE
jgi:hypothetical protein